MLRMSKAQATIANRRNASGAVLTAKQEAFCQEYLVDLNATQAAIRAGYSAKTAQEQGAQNLLKLMVQNRIAELQAVRAERVQITSDYVLNRLAEIDQLDVSDILNDDLTIRPLSQWPKAWRQFLSGVDIIELKSTEDVSALLKKIKWPDKLKNLELIGKHISVQAFKEQKEISGSLNIGTADSVRSAREARKK